MKTLILIVMLTQPTSHIELRVATDLGRTGDLYTIAYRTQSECETAAMVIAHNIANAIPDTEFLAACVDRFVIGPKSDQRPHR